MTSTWFFFSSWPIGFWLFFSFLQSTELLSKIPLRLESLAVFCAFVSVLHQRLFPRERQNRNKRVNWDGAYRADKLDVDELPDCCWSKMGWGAASLSASLKSEEYNLRCQSIFEEGPKIETKLHHKQLLYLGKITYPWTSTLKYPITVYHSLNLHNGKLYYMWLSKMDRLMLLKA